MPIRLMQGHRVRKRLRRIVDQERALAAKRLVMQAQKAQNMQPVYADKARLARARERHARGKRLERTGAKLYVKGAAVAGFGEGGIGNALIAAGAVTRGLGKTMQISAQNRMTVLERQIVKRRIGLTEKQRVLRRLKS